MKTMAYNSYQAIKFRNVLTKSALVLGLISSVLMATTANAGLVTGNAVFTIDNDAVTSSIPFPGYHFSKHWGTGDNAIVIDGTDGTDTTAIPATGNTTLSFAVNTNGTDVVHAGVDRVTRATTMDASSTSVGQIGLSGALQLTDGTGSLFPKDFYMIKTAGVWNIQAPFTGFGDPTLFTLDNVSETLNGNGELLLSGDLYWATAGFNWTTVTGGDGSIKLGTFSLTPSAVPLPAAVWLFASGLLGLVAQGRKKRTAV